MLSEGEWVDGGLDVLSRRRGPPAGECFRRGVDVSRPATAPLRGCLPALLPASMRLEAGRLDAALKL